MALRVVQAPGCRDIYSDSDLGVSAGDIVIDTGDNCGRRWATTRLSPTANTGITSCGVAAERLGDQGRGGGWDLDGVVRTSNPRKAVQRLLAVTGASKVEDHRVVTRRSVPENSVGFFRTTEIVSFSASRG